MLDLSCLDCHLFLWPQLVPRLKPCNFPRLVVAVLTTLQAFNLVASGLYLKADMANEKNTADVETSQIMGLLLLLLLIPLLFLLLLFHLLLPQYVTFKVHISAAAGALCILNAQCRTVFSLSVERCTFNRQVLSR